MLLPCQFLRFCRMPARFLGSVIVLLQYSLATAQHVHYDIPWVSSVVQSVTSQCAPYMSYNGPGGWLGSSHLSWGGPPTASPQYSSATLPPWSHGWPSSSSSIATSTSTTTTPSSVTSTSSCSTTPTPSPTQCSYWMEEIEHQGKAPFQNDTAYQVFRNVKDYGAVGDGITDDTAAINLAISNGNRCAPGNCSSSTRTPATVYFPAGVYLISSSIIDYYYTNLIGNPNCIPTLKATMNFTGLGLIDGDLYGANGLSYGATNVFWRQVRNFILDMTAIPHNSTATGIHWPTAQATSLQNIVFNMSNTNGTMHQGILIESGSGGFMTDLVFYGGLYGGDFGNQQFTMRNLSFYNSVTAINQLWDWGWTYYGINIVNCSVGLNMSTGGTTAQSVGSITFFDSTITDTTIGILTATNFTSQPPTAGSLVLGECSPQQCANCSPRTDWHCSCWEHRVHAYNGMGRGTCLCTHRTE